MFEDTYFSNIFHNFNWYKVSLFRYFITLQGCRNGLQNGGHMIILYVIYKIYTLFWKKVVCVCVWGGQFPSPSSWGPSLFQC